MNYLTRLRELALEIGNQPAHSDRDAERNEKDAEALNHAANLIEKLATTADGEYAIPDKPLYHPDRDGAGYIYRDGWVHFEDDDEDEPVAECYATEE